MKTKLSFGILLILYTNIGCTEDKENTEDMPSESIELLKMDKGGCFEDPNLNLKNGELSNDTLFYSVTNDSLVLTISMNNNCAACLIDSISIVDDHVNIYVKNDCGPFANCICSFEYKYFFDNYIEKAILFSVYLKDYKEDEYSLWNEIQYP
ncbi:MAG: hypothetical protein PF517_15325 [Salinivirgaceae bacterium]|jgi:hypothetical protein|nr:hypothetical protein [Salinivirgaceae bacterium]